MARKQKDLIESLLPGVVVVSFFGAFTMSSSLGFSIFIGLFVFFVLLALRISYLVHQENQLRKSGIHDIDKMTGVQFEHYLKALFKQKGYQAKVTKASGDYGADLVLQKGKRKIVVQAKRYKSNVGIKAVQEISSALHYYKADEAWCVTNSHYTAQAQTLAGKANVTLIDRQQLIQMALEVNEKKEKVKAV